MTQSPLRIPTSFAPERVALIREMEADGWIGRISSKGHAIMRAPDGDTTCSVAPKIGAPNREANQTATYRRWKRAQEAPADSAAISEVAAEVVVDSTTCPICGKGGFATPGYVRTHIAHAHKRVACPVCGQETSPAMSNRHLASHYRTPDSNGQLRRDNARLKAEVEKLRQEVEDWKSLAQEAIDLL